jgi:hypothetical protein
MEAGDQPTFDEGIAAQLIGKTILVGVTLKSWGGQIVDMRQVLGEIVEADARSGIHIARAEGGDYWLPPDTRSLQPAEPGEYLLHKGGSVTDPDYVTSWAIELEEGREFPEEGYRARD